MEQGIRGFVVGVNPVPPSISESKLNMPVDGVSTDTPAKSATFLRANKSEGFKLDATFNDDGRGRIALNVGVMRPCGKYGVVGVVMSTSCPDNIAL